MITTSEDAADCTAHPFDQHHCVLVQACLDGGAVLFEGRALGWGSVGLLRGKTSTGAYCTGFWHRDLRVSQGMGAAELRCSDGTRAKLQWHDFFKESELPSRGGTGVAGQDSGDTENAETISGRADSRPIGFLVGRDPESIRACAP